MPHASRIADDNRLFDLITGSFRRLLGRELAEAPERAERQRLLNRVNRNGFIADYYGIRIAKSGRRFRIANAIVRQLIDENGMRQGQAATFSDWYNMSP